MLALRPHHIAPSRRLATLLALLAASLPTPGQADPLDPLAFAPLGTLSLAAGQYLIDTSGAAPTLQNAAHQTLYTGVLFDQGTTFNRTVAVFDFQAISVAAGATLTASGDRPLALLSRAGFSLAGTLDAAGRNGGNQGAGVGGAGGPGAGAGGNGSPGTGQAQPGGGPGGGGGGYDGLGNGSWGNGGAHGGDGNGWNPALTASLAYGDLPHQLLAGSGGGGTGRNLFGTGAGGGGGGGAVELGASGNLTLAVTGKVLAAGGLGGSGLAVNGGGGSGGGLFFHAPSISFEASVLGLPEARADGESGGRIAFLTADGTVAGNLNSVTVSGAGFGHPGVITFGVLAAVPEPASLALMLSGLGGLVMLRARMRRQQAA